MTEAEKEILNIDQIINFALNQNHPLKEENKRNLRATLKKFIEDNRESYHAHKVESITDEIIENKIERFMPIAIKNRNGKLVNPYRNAIAYHKIKDNMVSCFSDLFNEFILNKNS